VGAVWYPEDFDWREIFSVITQRGEPRLRDSKKLSASQREKLHAAIIQNTVLKHTHAFIESEVIDLIGIVNAANIAATRALSALRVNAGEVFVLLDAGLKVPDEWRQESHVRGDENIPAISLASIVAKVSRDNRMNAFAEDYPGYGFEVHKGYGTEKHLSAIKVNGLTKIHRASFCHL
jgi:ribonuclease HII